MPGPTRVWLDRDAGRGYDRETMDRDVLALLDELELDRVDLVGHDWGGWIGFLLALRWPERIGRSVSLTIVPPWPSGDRRGVLEAWRIAYQIPLALPQLGRRAAEHGLARLGLRAGSDAFSEGEIEAFTDRLKGERARGASCFTGPFCCARPWPCLPDATPECPSKVPPLLLASGALDRAIIVLVGSSHSAVRADTWY